MNKHVDAPVLIHENVWEFNESNETGPYVDAYLIVGEKRALLIDALQTDTGIYEEIRKITDKPLEVFITHGHLDHAGAAIKEFYEAGIPIYMSHKDFDLLKGMFDYGEEKDWFIDLKPGMIFDLGGYRFHTLPIDGHSKGSMVALDYENQLLFSGDGIGSGHFWMQLPFCTALNVFQIGLKALYSETKKCPDLLIFPGHRNQSPVQLTGQYVRDTLYITNGLLNGVLKGEEASIPWMGGEMHYWHIGHGQMVDFCYDPANFFYGRPDPEIEAVKDQFTAREIRNGSHYMDYMFFAPALEEGKKYPLVVYLHGAGERGTDPRVALANSGGTVFASKEWQEKHPCFVAAPQVAPDEWWSDDSYTDLIAKLVRTLSQTEAIDSSRVYITGLSMGGMGTWKAISKYPELFAAAMPICGAADPFAVRNAKDVPVWAFHAADDPIVKADRYQNAPFANMVGSRWLVNSLRGAGNANVKYTEYPAGYMESIGMHPHASWNPAYDNSEAKEWLFSKSTYDRYEVHQICPGFYWIEDAKDASIYIVEGKDKALVIDTGWTDNDFIGMIESVTHLPYELAVTHAHGDHLYHLDKFDHYYMNEKDTFLLGGSRIKEAYGGKDYSKPRLIPVKDGDIIDLGGGYEVEVFDIGGHTPGSVVYLDKKRKIAMIGDALGVWMQVIGATNLQTYKENLIHFLNRMSAPEYEGVVMMAGHHKQEGGSFPYGDKYMPNDLQKVRDLITLCDLILNDDVEFRNYPFSFAKPAFEAKYGQATIIFTEDSLK